VALSAQATTTPKSSGVVFPPLAPLHAQGP